MIIIGSTAMQYWLPYSREPKDVDVFSTEKVEGFDCIIVPQEIIELIPYKMPPKVHSYKYATLDAIYTIKCSHLGWDISWNKHKNDVLYLKSIGCKKIPELYDALVNFWRKENGNKEYLSLYKKKSDFFNDYVPYVYDHDYLHDLVAYPYPPVYTNCLRDGEDVAIDKDKFLMLPLDQQLRMFKEEISVIAAERWLIPPKICGKYSWIQAYQLSVHKTVTSLTKNWATDFMIDHLDYLVKPDYSYFEHMFNTIKEKNTIMANEVKNAEAVRDEIFETYNEIHPEDPFEEYDMDWGYFVDEVPDFGEFESIQQDGGGEGGGEYCYKIFKWKNEYYRLDYSYYSYHGYDFDDATLYKVNPVQKMVTVYE